MRKDLEGPKTRISDLDAIREFLLTGGNKDEYFDSGFQNAG